MLGLVTIEAVLVDPNFYFSGTSGNCLHLRDNVMTGSDVKFSGNFCLVPDKVKYTVSNFRTLYLMELELLSSRLVSIKFGVLLLGLMSAI